MRVGFYLGYTDRPDELEVLGQTARERECSEYDLFHAAGARWNVPRDRVQADFSSYLLQQELPPYVRSELRSSGFRYDPHRDVRLMLEFASRTLRRLRAFFRSSE